MALYTLENVVSIARSQSDFYKKLYNKVPVTGWSLEDLPVIDPKEFWQANNFDNNKVITSSLRNGLILTSGGSTGKPKFSVYSKDEWFTQSKVLGHSLKNTGLIKNGDRVANLVSVGRLYGAFLLIHDALMNSLSDCLELPISRDATIEYIADIIQRFNANTIVGFPLTLVNLSSYVRKNKIKLGIERIIYGGETMYSEQLDYIKKTFPQAQVSTCVYSSSDGGLMGYWDRDCLDNEHRVEDTCAILEILDNDGNVINEPYKEGMLYVTSLMKILMPVIRYPVGDRAMWLEGEKKNRKFKLLGRSENLSINIHNVNIDQKNLSEVVAGFSNKIEIIGFQLVISKKSNVEYCVLKIACENLHAYHADELRNLIANEVKSRFPGLNELTRNKFMLFDVEFVAADKIETNPGSGKHRRILDLRA